MVCLDNQLFCFAGMAGVKGNAEKARNDQTSIKAEEAAQISRMPKYANNNSATAQPSRALRTCSPVRCALKDAFKCTGKFLGSKLWVIPFEAFQIDWRIYLTRHRKLNITAWSVNCTGPLRLALK